MQLPIRTNMGTDYPKGKLLGKRELYVYQKTNGDYELWIGNNDDGTAKQLMVKKSYISNGVDNTLISAQSGQNTGIIAGLEVAIQTVDEGGNTVDVITIEPRETFSDVTVKSVKLEDIQRLVVSSDNFGSNPNEVKNPQHGQLYFKI